MIILPRQIEEEVGSAEEQPSSNKFDDYTIIKRIVFFSYPFLIIGNLIWLKKTYTIFDFYRTNTISKNSFGLLNSILYGCLSCLLNAQKTIPKSLLN